MGIERFVWTDHAAMRLTERGLTQFEVEEVIREGHESRVVNHGDADWRIYGIRADGQRFAVIYDHPAMGDPAQARIISAWPLREPTQT